MKLAIDNGYDIHFNRFKVSIINHRGSIILKDIIDKNVLSISKTTDKFKGTNSYALSLYSPDEVEIGDEVNLKFSKLGIDTVVRVMGMKRQPYSSKRLLLKWAVMRYLSRIRQLKLYLMQLTKIKATTVLKSATQMVLKYFEKMRNPSVIMNADEFRMQAKRWWGSQRQVIFDPVTNTYKFVGTVSIMGGSIDIGGHFKVDPDGNAYPHRVTPLFMVANIMQAPGETRFFSNDTGFEVLTHRRLQSFVSVTPPR